MKTFSENHKILVVNVERGTVIIQEIELLTESNLPNLLLGQISKAVSLADVVGHVIFLTYPPWQLFDETTGGLVGSVDVLD